MCRTCRDVPGTSLELIPDVTDSFDDAALDLMTAVSVAVQRPLNWNVLPVTAATAGEAASKLAAGDHAERHGGRVVALTVP